MDNMLMYSMYDALLSSQLCHVSIFFSTFTMHVAPCFISNHSAPEFEGHLIYLVVEPTPLKNMIVKLDHFPKVRGANSKNHWSCHQLVMLRLSAMENWCLKFHQSIDDNSAAQHRHPEFFPVAPPDLHHILLRKCRDNGHHLGITKHHFFMEGGRWTPPNFRYTGGINHESSWRENTQVDIWMKLQHHKC